MKKFIAKKDDMLERKAEINPEKIYETAFGDWVAEVPSSEFGRACRELCHGVDRCSCANMHGVADEDDDGKKYRLVSV